MGNYIWTRICLLFVAVLLFLALFAINVVEVRRVLADKDLQTQIDDMRAKRADDAAKLAEAIDQGILALEDLPGTIRERGQCELGG
jgi:hypothetical protein